MYDRIEAIDIGRTIWDPTWEPWPLHDDHGCSTDWKKISRCGTISPPLSFSKAIHITQSTEGLKFSALRRQYIHMSETFSSGTKTIYNQPFYTTPPLNDWDIAETAYDTIQSINQSVQWYRIYNQPIYIDLEYTINQCIQRYRIYNQPMYTMT